MEGLGKGLLTKILEPETQGIEKGRPPQRRPFSVGLFPRGFSSLHIFIVWKSADDTDSKHFTSWMNRNKFDSFVFDPTRIEYDEIYKNKLYNIYINS